MRRAWTRTACGFAVVVVLGVGAVSVVGQRPSVDTSMESLVREVRALRLAVERSGVVTAQAQMVLGRLQLQENRLATLGRQAQDARMRLQEGISRLSDTQAELAGQTHRLQQAETDDDRRAMERAISNQKAVVKQAQARVDQLRDEDSAASQALATEQSRWTDINERLETLERSLTAARQP